MKFDVSDLVARGLVVVKAYENGLSVLKYDRKVFFNNSWGKDARLLECRGRIVDANWNVIVNPFKKVFNYGENGTGKALRTDCLYREVDKLNGFLGCFTRHPKYGNILSTTGSMDSMHVGLFRELFEEEFQHVDNVPYGVTMMFEVCHPSDPHIVAEDVGIHLIGARFVETDERLSEAELDELAEYHMVGRPGHRIDTLENICKRAYSSKREGVMVCALSNDEHLFKLKTPHYLTKKLFMRLGKGRVEHLFKEPEQFKKWLKDEEFFGFVDFLTTNLNVDLWKMMQQEERRNYIEGYFSKNNAF